MTGLTLTMSEKVQVKEVITEREKEHGNGGGMGNCQISWVVRTLDIAVQNPLSRGLL